MLVSDVRLSIMITMRLEVQGETLQTDDDMLWNLLVMRYAWRQRVH